MFAGGWLVVYTYVMSLPVVQMLIAISYTILPLVMVARMIGGSTTVADVEE